MTKRTNRQNKIKTVLAQVSHLEPKKATGFFDKLKNDLDLQHSYINLILGVLIVGVIAILLFNYFSKPKGEVSQISQITQESTTTQQIADVNKDNLPGKYTIKEGDTLTNIAKNYYGDSFLYEKIAEINKLQDANIIEVGQVIDIPKIDTAATKPTSTLNAQASPNPTTPVEGGTGGAINQTEWGEKISGDTYVTQSGDWLSKIAGRAYGDIYAFDKIAKANNITNPDEIEPGMVLKIPR